MHAWLAGSRQQVQTITGLLLFVLCLSTKTFKKPSIQYLGGSQDQSTILEEFRTKL